MIKNENGNNYVYIMWENLTFVFHLPSSVSDLFRLFSLCYLPYIINSSFGYGTCSFDVRVE